MDFGLYIRSLRKEKGLTLRETAKRAEVSHPYLSQLENGKNENPTPQIIKKLAKGLNTSYEQLLEKAGHLQPGETDRRLKMTKWVSNNQESLKNSLSTFQPTSDLQQILTDKAKLNFNGHELDQQDKERILTMLSALFPEYVKKRP